MAPGDTIFYTVTVKNTGLSALSSVRIEDTLPPASVDYVLGTTIRKTPAAAPVSDNLAPQTPFPLDEGGIVFTNMPAGATWSVYFQVKVKDLGCAANFENTATVTAIKGSRTITLRRSVTTEVDCPGILIIRKQVVGTVTPQSFNFDTTTTVQNLPPQIWPTTFPLAITSASQVERTFSLPAGTYTVQEQLPVAPWSFTSLSCTTGGTANQGTRTASVVLAESATVTCTYVNTRASGTINVAKTVVPNDTSTNWNFGGNGPTTFTGSTVGSGTFQRTVATGGPYTIVESAGAGTVLANYDTTWSCSATNPVATASGTGLTATIPSVSSAQIWSCTFTNTKRGSIQIEKQTLPDGDTQSFSFTGAIAGSLTDGQSSTVLSVSPGAYAVVETVQSGWDLTNINCTDPTTNSSGNVGTRTAAFNVAPGEAVKCVFTNTKYGSIVINKTALGGDASFDFESTGGLNPASFVVATTGGSGRRGYNLSLIHHCRRPRAILCRIRWSPVT